MQIKTKDLTNFVKAAYFKDMINSCIIEVKNNYPFIHAQSSCTNIFAFSESPFAVDFSCEVSIGDINEFLKLIPKSEEVYLYIESDKDNYVCMKSRGTLKYAMTDPVYISSRIKLDEGLSSWNLVEELQNYPYQYELDSELIKELKSALALTTSNVCVKAMNGKLGMEGGGDGEHMFSFEIGECEENVEFFLDNKMLSMVLAKNNEMHIGFDVGCEFVSLGYGNVLYALRTC